MTSQRFVPLSVLVLLGTAAFAENPAVAVELRNRYPAGGIHYLGAGGNPIACGPDARDAAWRIAREGDEWMLVHEASGKGLGFDDGDPVAVDAAKASRLIREEVADGWFRLRAPDQGLVHAELRNGFVQVGGAARSDWWSAQWEIVERAEVGRLDSPDARIALTFSLANGRPEYAVEFGEELVIAPSPLGLEFDARPALAGPFRVVATERRLIDETWAPVWGQRAEMVNRAAELEVRLEETATTRRQLNLIFRVSDDGVAFRYVLPEQPNLDRFAITDELTEFRLISDAETWWCEALPDTYERDYQQTDLGEASARGTQTPVTLRSGGGTYVSLHEAALIDWAGMKLKRASEAADFSLKADLVPWFGSETKVRGETPARSPWRTIQLADRPGALIESSLIPNLNEPAAIDDTSWIRPSKFMGIWWGMITNVWTWDHDDPDRHGATTERAKRYIDACAEMGIDGLLVEGWCEGWSGGIPGWRNMQFTNPAPDFDILELVRYGREKGVRLVGHHETGGDIPNYEKQVEAAFSFYQKLGIDTVKTGYVTGDIPVYTDTPPGREHHHGQYMVRHHQRIVELAAKYRIMINAHEPIKATGLSRTWPNFIAREGARGGEFNAFVGNPPSHATILPFTRLLGGPMDYTPGLFDCAFQPDKPFSTRANQLALYIVLWSPLHMAADHYQAYQGEPAAEWIRQVPVGTWDETRVLDAAIGDYVVIARRQGREWFIGAVNDENARSLTLDVAELFGDREPREAIFYADAADADYRDNPHAMKFGKRILAADRPLELNLRPGGGTAIRVAAPGTSLEVPRGQAGTPPSATPLRLRAKHSDRALTLDDTSLIQHGLRAGDGGQRWRLEPEDDGLWRIALHGQVLTATGNANGSAVVLDADRGEPTQRWRFEPVAGSLYRIANAASGRLLDVSEGRYDDGAPIHLWENAHAANQIWWIDLPANAAAPSAGETR